jgi:hypothetical protein
VSFLMKKNIEDPIATTSFEMVRPDGTRATVTAVLGRPYFVSDHEACCPVALEGVDGRYADISGGDSLHALCLALRLLQMRLEDKIEAGCVLVDPGGNRPLSVADLAVSFGFGPDASAAAAPPSKRGSRGSAARGSGRRDEP